ncbi:MAG: hypothetical protein H6841_02000 [Planctomycetes bacterium]|nr:hypothetical protein [Planctomycetota bacterium]MCB9935167.1 hypothetical protein [Planctomycetota bacterium]
MKRILMCCFSLLAVGLVQAQDEPAEGSPEYYTNNYFRLIDDNKNDEVSYEELKKYMKAEAGQDSIKSPDGDKYFEQLYLFLPDYVAADTSDDCSLTKAELLAFYQARAANKGYKPPLSVADVNIIRAEMLDPLALLSIKAIDTDIDGKISKQEQEAYDKAKGNDSGMFEVVDTDKDEQLSFGEVVAFFQSALLAAYELPADEYDFSSCYRKKGNTWVVHFEDHTPDGLTFNQQVEVLEVLEDRAKVEITMLDKDLKPVEGKPANRAEVKFETQTGPKAKGKYEPVIAQETITVKAGEFECRKVTVDEIIEKTTSWYSLAHPGLLVKSEHIAEGKITYEYELYRFTEGKD